MYPTWMTIYSKAAALDAGEYPIQFADMEPAPEPGPEIPAEVHNMRPVSSEAAIAAVRAMCQGVK